MMKLSGCRSSRLPPTLLARADEVRERWDFAAVRECVRGTEGT
jgi:hypothetical protein